MTDIPRNELLQKLADGWEVRAKSWGSDIPSVSNKDKGFAVSIGELLNDEWCGVEPEKLIDNALRYTTAYNMMLNRKGESFIRLPDWPDSKRVTVDDGELVFIGFSPSCLFSSELNSKEWEVWE